MGFVRKIDEPVYVKGFKGGAGVLKKNNILRNEEEMYGKGRVFAHMTLEPGNEIGQHTHTGDGETYYILKGEGTYVMNGETWKVSAGDVLFADDGDTHFLRAEGDEPMEFIALVLFK